jgi:G3E family GTPase
VGIDGAALMNDDLPIAEIAGGCLCCVAGPQMTATVATLLRRERGPPADRGQWSGPCRRVIDELRAKPLGEALEVGAVLTLVDPRQFVSPDYLRQPLYRDQVAIADVLVANKTDMADVETLDAFRAQAGKLFPPKSVIAEVRDGLVEVSWLDAAVTVKPRYRPPLRQTAVMAGIPPVGPSAGAVLQRRKTDRFLLRAICPSWCRNWYVPRACSRCWTAGCG